MFRRVQLQYLHSIPITLDLWHCFMSEWSFINEIMKELKKSGHH